jgi:acyl-CoA synthetase (AMP-forming)/AMP-acid ligase II
MFETTLTLGDLCRKMAAAYLSRPAVVYNGEVMTFATLEARASSVANGLTRAGLGLGDRIAILDRNHPSFFELLYGAAKIGAVIVPINFRLASPEIVHVLNDSGASMLVIGPEFEVVIEQIRPELRSVKLILKTSVGGAGSFSAWRDSQSPEDAAVPIDPDSVAVQMYTSGTTGLPKGAQLTHRNFFIAIHHCVKAWEGPAADDVSLLAVPLFHVAGTGWGMVSLHCGIPIILMREFVPGAVLEAIAQHRVSWAFLVPAAIQLLLDHPDCGKTDFKSLCKILYGASPISRQLLGRAIAVFKCQFGQVYGLTEAAGMVTFLGPKDHAEGSDRLTSCGKPIPGVELRVVGSEGQELPPGAIGEIVCRTPQIMKGYWRLSAETAQVIRDGWLSTGDVGYADPDGYLYICDRAKDMIISGGENIYSSEVEGAFWVHPMIADVAVIGVPDLRWGEVAKACVVLKPGASVAEDEILSFVRERIASYKVPKSIDFMPALPRNPSGKVLKHELRRPYWEGHERQVS